MIREELTLQEKFDLRKKIRMTDVMRGIFYPSETKRGEVCRYYKFNSSVQLINCQNYNKYTSVFGINADMFVVLYNDEPVGIVCSKDAKIIYKFWSTEKYKDWDENRICKLLNDNNLDSLKFWALDDSDMEAWETMRQQALFKEHLKFEDDFLAYLWRNMGVSMTEQQLQEYTTTIYMNRDSYTDKQKESIAKEIVFYIIPQYLSNVWEEAEQQITELCRFVMEEYGIVWRDHVSIKQTQLRLKQLFLIDTVEKAKEYYIANECAVERYKNCCMDADYEEIMDSFEQWSHVIQEKQWRKEALERCFHAQDVYKDWNVERMVELISHLHVDVSMLERLKSYIADNLHDIHVWDVLSFHIQMLIPDYKDNSELQRLWEECCKALRGFEYKKLDMEEKERFRKILNSTPCGEYQYVNCAKNIIVLWGYTRLQPPWDPQEPRHDEWQPDKDAPIMISFLGEEGLLGRLEVSDFCVIWNVIEGDRQKLVDLYTEYARDVEIIPQEREIRDATKEEAEGWEEKAERYCIGNANFLGSTEWWLGTKKEISPRLMREVIREIKSEDKCYVGWMLSLVFYVLPNIERKSELWTREDMVCINEYLSRTLKDFTGEETVPSDYTPEALIAAYRPYCLGNRLEVAKKIYKYFNCKKRRCLGNSGSYLYYDELWDSYNQFDISEYEREWMQEEFALEKESVYKFASRFLQSACYILDLLEKIGTYENYKWFKEEIEKFKDHEYICFRLEKMSPNIEDEHIRKLVQDFCEQLQTEVNEGRTM